jgi:hypothetical protein
LGAEIDENASDGLPAEQANASCDGSRSQLGRPVAWRLADSGNTALIPRARFLYKRSDSFLLNPAFDPKLKASVSSGSTSVAQGISRSSVLSLLVDLSTNRVAE